MWPFNAVFAELIQQIATLLLKFTCKQENEHKAHLTLALTLAITSSFSISSKISQIQAVNAFVSSTPKPRRVIAGVPKRKPEVTNGERGSLGTEFLFTVI